MKDAELRENWPIDTFDNTIISTYQKCHRNLYWFLRRYRAEVNPPYFAFGRAFGQGINKWHELQDCNLNHTDRQNSAIDVARTVWETASPIEKGNDNLANLIELIEIYCSFYGKEESWEIIKTEIGFKLPFPGIDGFFYAGSLDSYLVWEPFGVLDREDKTTGNYITKGYIDQFSHSTQVTGYEWALSQITDAPVFGSLINIASKRPRKEPDLRLARDLQKRSPWKLSTWVKETLEIMREIRNEFSSWKWHKTGERNPQNCAGGPGLSPCPYRNLCLLDSDPWSLKDDSFSSFGLVEIETPWEPWERSGNDE